MNRDLFIRELGIELFASACSASALRHDHLVEPLDIAPHHHDNEIQFDLVRGCRGKVFTSGRWLRFDSDIALVAYPGETHGYTLEPTDATAAVYNIKVEPNTPLGSLNAVPLPRLAQHPSAGLFETAASLSVSISPYITLENRSILGILSLLVAWPDGGPSSVRRGLGDEIHPVVERAVTTIEENLHDPLGLDDIARAAGISSRQLARLFEQAMGMTPHRYSTTRRLDRAKTVLLSNQLSIGEIADLLGFSGHATFTRWFAQHTGMTPSGFRSNPKVF